MMPERKPDVTLEDLLRVKRAEQPKAEFWAQFDQELRAKQLAALVQKQPWWRTLPRSFGGLARFHLPLGATAVLAITLLSIRDYQPISPAAGVAVGGTDARATEEVAPIQLPAVSVQQPIESTAEVVAASLPAPATAALTAANNSGGELARMVPTISSMNGSGLSVEELRPSARSIAVNRAAAEAMLGTPAAGFETRAIPVRNVPPEPLAQMSNPSETRRSRFAVAFAAAGAAAIGTSSAPTARVARRLSDEQLYDSIHRFGASGNSVSIRF